MMTERERESNLCEKCQKSPATTNLDIQGWKKWVVCANCCQELQLCSKCKKNKSTNLIEEGKEKIQVCIECAGDKNEPIDIPKPINDKDKPIDKPIDKGKKPDNKEPDKRSNPDECCEKCGASCIIHQDKTSYTIKRKRYIKHKTDFTRESSCWFGTNCPCAREFREANQQTCPQCKRREFPHMKRGWLLDYEIKKAFCSPLCHVTYREWKWEEAQQRLSRVEMFPPELEVANSGNQPNFNWEREGMRNEMLFLRETVRQLQQTLDNQTNQTPEEQQQNNYLQRLQQNTLRNAEDAYQSRYGSLETNPSNSNKGDGMGGGMIALLIIGGIAIVGGFIYLLIRSKKKSNF